MHKHQDIPKIDLSPFVDPGIGNGAHVVEEVGRACQETGFFVITGHGIAPQLITRIYQTSRAFFDLPVDVKRRIGKSGQVAGGLMYFPLESEHLASTRGNITPGDLKESLDYGPQFGGDPWPDEMPDLQQAWLAYYAAMSGLCGHIRRLFALALGLREDFFEDKFQNHRSSLRVLNYPEPPSKPLPGQLRAGAHSDYGFVTILKSEEQAGGLQVQRRDGTWVDVPTVPGAFVVNIGDAMMRWTNDHWVSTLHRVVNPGAGEEQGSRRQSIAFFHNPNPDAEIRCLDAFCVDVPARYDPITWVDYAEMKRHDAAGSA